MKRVKVELSAPTLKACLAHLCGRQSEGLGTFELLDLAEAARGLWEIESAAVLEVQAEKALKAGWMTPIKTVKAQAPKRRGQNWEEAQKNRAAAEKSGLTFDDLDKALAEHGIKAYADAAGMKPANAGQVVTMARRRGYLPPSALKWLEGLKGEEPLPPIPSPLEEFGAEKEPKKAEKVSLRELREKFQQESAKKPDDQQVWSKADIGLALAGGGIEEAAALIGWPLNVMCTEVAKAKKDPASMPQKLKNFLRDRLGAPSWGGPPEEKPEEPLPPSPSPSRGRGEEEALERIYWSRARFCCLNQSAQTPGEKKLLRGWVKSGGESIDAYLKGLKSDELGVLV